MSEEWKNNLAMADRLGMAEQKAIHATAKLRKATDRIAELEAALAASEAKLARVESICGDAGISMEDGDIVERVAFLSEELGHQIDQSEHDRKALAASEETMNRIESICGHAGIGPADGTLAGRVAFLSDEFGHQIERGDQYKARLADATAALAASEARASQSARDYEELRRLIDGGSESMTHADAVQEIIDTQAAIDSTKGRLDHAEVALDVQAKQLAAERAARERAEARPTWTRDDVTPEMVAFVEDDLGMSCGAWDMEDPRDIIASAINAAALTPPAAAPSPAGGRDA